jgi:hypothetical protein
MQSLIQRCRNLARNGHYARSPLAWRAVSAPQAVMQRSFVARCADRHLCIRVLARRSCKSRGQYSTPTTAKSPGRLRARPRASLVVEMPGHQFRRCSTSLPSRAENISSAHSHGRPAPTVSAATAPREPNGLLAPTVESRAVWRSIWALSSAPRSTTIVEIHSHIIKPTAAPSEP